jgi:hypothetical protein
MDVKTQKLCSYEMMIIAYENKRYHNLEGGNPNSHNYENLKSQSNLWDQEEKGPESLALNITIGHGRFFYVSFTIILLLCLI